MSDARESQRISQEDIDELVYQFACLRCGGSIEAEVDPNDWPTGPIPCPECGGRIVEVGRCGVTNDSLPF